MQRRGAVEALSFGSSQAVLFEEGHSQEEDIVEFFPHLCIVFLFYDLAERVTDIRIEFHHRTRVLGFDDGSACISTVDDDDIWSAIANFVVGLHIIATADEEADEDGMIEVFMMVIMKTDAVQKDLGKLPSETFAIASPEGVKQFFARSRLHGVGEPGSDRLDENFADFLVGDDKARLIAKAFFLSFGQITGEIKHTPEILFGGMHRVIGQAFDKLDFNAVSGKECLNFLLVLKSVLPMNFLMMLLLLVLLQ